MIDISHIQNLLDLCWPTFVEIDRAVFLADVLPPSGIELHSFSDRTDAEAFYNHVHIAEHLTVNPLSSQTPYSLNAPIPAASIPILQAIARSVVDMWRTKLHRDFPHYQFRLYLTLEHEPIIRFHMLRNDEAAWLNQADWQQQLANGTLCIVDTQ